MWFYYVKGYKGGEGENEWNKKVNQGRWRVMIYIVLKQIAVISSSALWLDLCVLDNKSLSY